jgi:hypothetical protein
MDVLECFLFGHTPEEIISNNLVEFVEENYKNKVTFKIKIVREGMNPQSICRGVIGNCKDYNAPCILIQQMIGH